VLEPAGKDILDTNHNRKTFLTGTINKTHTLTKTNTVRLLLLFKEGDTITRASITESERLLRKFLKIRDARIIAVPVSPNSKNYKVTVMIQDLIAFNVGIASLNNIATYSAADRNFLGRGSTVLGSLSYYKGRYSYYSLFYEDPSVYNSYVDLTLNYSSADSNVTNGIRLNKNFFTGLFGWAGGIGYAYKNMNHYLFSGTEATGMYTSLMKQTDAWAGKAFTLNIKDKKKQFH